MPYLLPKLKVKGFTLLELLVVVAIIGGLMALLLPQMSKFSNYQSLEDSAEQLQSALRTAQNNATSGTQCGSGIAASEWYLQFLSSTQYKVGVVCSDQASSPTPTPLPTTTYNLPSGVSVSKVEVSRCSGENSGINLVSSSPRVSYSNVSGLVTFQHSNPGCPMDSSYRWIKFTLQLDSSTTNKLDVVVEKGGAIFLN